MKPNEKIGVAFTAAAVISSVLWIASLKTVFLALLILCALGQTIFLSWWGLETFNKWFEK